MFGVVLLSASLLFSGDESAYLTRVDNLHNQYGLFADRQSDHTIVSSAATGLGILALAESVSRGLRDRDHVTQLARSAFHHTVDANPRRNRGWLSHFTDATGQPKSSSEVSTIDTAIFYCGLLEAATLLNDHELASQVRQSLNTIDTQFVLRDGIFLHGFRWNNSNAVESDDLAIPDFIPYLWNDSSEGVILYHLFSMPFPLQIVRTDYPLFVYAYPLCFFDIPSYESFLQAAIEEQITRYGYWGVTSTDGPDGYVIMDRHVISPVLIGGIATKYPAYLESLKSIMIHPTAVSMHLLSGWVDSDDLTIDLCSAYVLFSRWTRQNNLEQSTAVPMNVDNGSQ